MALESFVYNGPAWMIKNLEELSDPLWPSFRAKRSEDGEEWICYGTPTDLEVLRDFGIGPGSLEERAEVARFKEAFLKADSIEILKLYPRCTPSDRQGWFKRYFHHYEILYSTVARGEQKTKLVESLWQGMEDGPPVSMCFEPRHAMVAEVDGQLYELCICFSCAIVRGYLNDEPRCVFPSMDSSPRVLFNKTLQRQAQKTIEVTR
jgi:hypothetical protein